MSGIEDASDLGRIIVDEIERNPRIVKLEESQAHLSRQFESLAETVATQFNNIERSLQALVSNFHKQREVSWPLIVSIFIAGLSALGLTFTLLTGYVGLRVTPLEISHGYIDDMRKELNDTKVELKVKAAILETENRYRDAAINSINSGSPHKLP